MLRDKDYTVRRATLEAFGSSQATLSETVQQALVETLKDEEEAVRISATAVLGLQTILSEFVQQALVAALKAESMEGLLSAKVLGSQATLSESVQQALVKVLMSEDVSICKLAAKALGSQAALSEAVQQVLVEAVKDEDGIVSYLAIEALGLQVTLSESGQQVLVEGLMDEDQNSNVRYWAGEALCLSQVALSEAVQQVLVEMLKGENLIVRYFAREGLCSQATLSELSLRSLMVIVINEKDSEVNSYAGAILYAFAETNLLNVIKRVITYRNLSVDFPLIFIGSITNRAAITITKSEASEQYLLNVFSGFSPTITTISEEWAEQFTKPLLETRNSFLNIPLLPSFQQEKITMNKGKEPNYTPNPPRQKEENTMLSITTIQPKIDQLYRLAKSYKNDPQDPDACFKAVECYSLARSMLAQVQPTDDTESESIAVQRNKCLKKIASTIKKHFIHNRLRIAEGITLDHLSDRISSYQQTLTLIRQRSRGDLNDYLSSISRELSELMESICTDALFLLDLHQQTQTGFVFVLLGSLATQQALAYSDVEYIILLDEAKLQENRVQYEALAKLIELLVMSLGETPVFYAKQLLTQESSGYKTHFSAIPKGFRVDEAKRPTATNWQISLINGTKYYVSPEAQKTFRAGNHLSSALLQPRRLLGDAGLFRQYQQQLHRKIREGAYDKFLTELFHYNSNEVNSLLEKLEIHYTQTSTKNLSYLINIKYLAIPAINLAQQLLYRLSRQHNSEHIPLNLTIWETLERLKDHKQLSEEGYQGWHRLIQQVFTLRREMQAHPTPHSQLTLEALNKRYQSRKESSVDESAAGITQLITDLQTVHSEAKRIMNQWNQATQRLDANRQESTQQALHMLRVVPRNTQDQAAEGPQVAAGVMPQGQRAETRRERPEPETKAGTFTSTSPKF